MKTGDITTWIFDLDNTIYPRETGLFDQIVVRITAYLAEKFSLPLSEAKTLQRGLIARHGTTMNGLVTEYKADARHFLDYVHDIDIAILRPDPELDQGIAALPGRKIILTDGSVAHATRILNAYGIERHFDCCYDTVALAYRPKSDPSVYDDFISATNIEPDKTSMIDDRAVNLQPAAALGVTTIWINDDDDEVIRQSEAELAHINYIARDLKDFLSTYPQAEGRKP